MWDCSMLLVHAGAFGWMTDAVDHIAKQATSDEMSANQGSNLPPSRYIDVWNTAVSLGLEGCSGHCPIPGAVGAELAGGLTIAFGPLCIATR